MSARAAIASLLGTDSQMNMLDIDETVIYASNATDSPDRTRMFLVVRFEEVGKSFPGVGPSRVAIWFHVPKEKEQDYGKLDLLMLRTKELMQSVEHRDGADGWRLTAPTWDGDSGDLFDDGYNTLTRYSTYRCAVRNLD